MPTKYAATTLLLAAKHKGISLDLIKRAYAAGYLNRNHATGIEAVYDLLVNGMVHTTKEGVEHLILVYGT